MKTLLLSLAAATALTAAVTPAAAQTYQDRTYQDRAYQDRDYQDGGYQDRADWDRGDRGYSDHRGRNDRDMSIGRIRDLDERVSEARRDGRISRYTAANLDRQVRGLAEIARRYRSDGVVTGYERADFERRYAYVSHSITKLARLGVSGRDYGRNDWRR